MSVLCLRQVTLYALRDTGECLLGRALGEVYRRHDAGCETCVGNTDGIRM